METQTLKMLELREYHPSLGSKTRYYFSMEDLNCPGHSAKNAGVKSSGDTITKAEIEVIPETEFKHGRMDLKCDLYLTFDFEGDGFGDLSHALYVLESFLENHPSVKIAKIGAVDTRQKELALYYGESGTALLQREESISKKFHYYEEIVGE